MILEKTYPFLLDNLLITVVVNPEEDESFLRIDYFDSGTITKIHEISCIHTVVNQDTFFNLESNLVNDEFMKNNIKIVLSPNEKFFAMKSWEEGIIQNDLKSLIIRVIDEPYLNFMIPLVRSLLFSLLLVDMNLIKEYIRMIKRICVFNDEIHRVSLDSNISQILNVIVIDEDDENLGFVIPSKLRKLWKNNNGYMIHPAMEEIMELIIELNPSPQVFTDREKFSVLLPTLRNKYKRFKEIEHQNCVKVKNKTFWMTRNELGKNVLFIEEAGIVSLNELRGFTQLKNLNILGLWGNLMVEFQPTENMITLTDLFINQNKLSKTSNMGILQNL